MYKGILCDCKACRSLTEEQRQEKYARIMAARRRGGKTRAAQPSMAEARSAGFWATMDRHPFFARKWLKKIIRGQNQRRARIAAAKILIPERKASRRRSMN